jgi:hypothetical protein
MLSLNLSCRTVPPQAPFDLTQPGWTIRQGQAIWRTRSPVLEIAGELLVALHPDGCGLVQFTKVPLPVVLAQASKHSWQIEFAADNKHYSGPGAPPEQLVWFELVRVLRKEKPSRGWTFAEKPDGAWRLEHASTGEVLEGYFAIPSGGQP